MDIKSSRFPASGEREMKGEKSRIRRLEVIVHGRVQGVNFRYFTLRRADELGLVGYVRNRWDGTVEVVAEGEEGKLKRLLEYLRVGPRAAWVREVEVRWSTPGGQFTRFEVRF